MDTRRRSTRYRASNLVVRRSRCFLGHGRKSAHARPPLIISIYHRVRRTIGAHILVEYAHAEGERHVTAHHSPGRSRHGKRSLRWRSAANRPSQTARYPQVGPRSRACPRPSSKGRRSLCHTMRRLWASVDRCSPLEQAELKRPSPPPCSFAHLDTKDVRRASADPDLSPHDSQ